MAKARGLAVVVAPGNLPLRRVFQDLVHDAGLLLLAGQEKEQVWLCMQGERHDVIATSRTAPQTCSMKSGKSGHFRTQPGMVTFYMK